MESKTPARAPLEIPRKSRFGLNAPARVCLVAAFVLAAFATKPGWASTEPVPAAEPDWQSVSAEIKKKYGVEVFVDEVAFPAEWGDDHLYWMHVDDKFRTDALLRVAHDLSKYNPAFIRKNLSRIYVVERMSIDGLEWGGTVSHWKSWMYLTRKGIGSNPDYSGDTYVGGLHHELMHILFRRYRDQFPEAAWLAANPGNFAYLTTEDPKLKLTSENDIRERSTHHEKGFINGYQMTALNEDVCEYSRMFLARTAYLRKLSKKHARIDVKAKLVEQFLRKLGAAPDR